MTNPRVGQRIEVVKEDWGDAGFSLPVGATGTVSKIELNNDGSYREIVLDLDEDYDTTEGGWMFYDYCDPPDEPLDAFNYHVKVTDDPSTESNT